LRNEDNGFLWEHYVLNEMMAQLQSKEIRYWRNKQGHEVDFIWLTRKKQLFAIECKWSSNTFEPNSLLKFHQIYPQSELLLVAQDIQQGFTKKIKDVIVRYCSLSELISLLKS
jgi:predicted AAA+ superfamily ATPase